jgi:nucleoid-associated protein YgaU
MQQTVTVANLARQAAEQQDLMRSFARMPGGVNVGGRGYQRYLERYFANAGRGTGPGAYNWVAAGPGHVLGRAGNAAAGAGAGAAALNVPAHVLQMAPFQAYYAPPFTAEEYAELERQGIPLPLPTRYLQEQGIIRRPGESLPPSSILRRGLGALAIGGLLAGNPVAAGAGAGGLIVQDAFRGPPLGASQLRIPAATRRASFANRTAVRPFHNRDPTYAVSAGYGINSTARTHNVRNNQYPSRPSSRTLGKNTATLSFDRVLPYNNARREGPSGAMGYPRPNGRGTANNNRTNRNHRRNVARDPWVRDPRAAEEIARQRAAGVEINEKINAAANAMLRERIAAEAAEAAAEAAAAPAAAAAAAAAPAAAAAAAAAAPAAAAASAPASFFNMGRFFRFGGSRRTRNVRKNKRTHTKRKLSKK